MKIIQTWFDNCGRPRGKIVTDGDSGTCAVIPAEDKSPLPDRHWTRVDELRAALDAAFNAVKGKR